MDPEPPEVIVEDTEQQEQAELQEELAQDESMMSRPDDEEQEEQEEEDQPTVKVRKPRKRKARALDAHLYGLGPEERAALLASIADESSPGPSRRENAPTESAQPEEEDEEPQEPEKEPTQPREVIEARRKVLRTSWRMAAFSQFCSAFPHLAIKDFDIVKLEKDLDGTDENSYIGDVLSRLLYTLTRDSRLAGKDFEKPWLFSLRREYLKYDPAHNPLGDWPLYAEEEYPTASTDATQIKQEGTEDTVPGSAIQQPVPAETTAPEDVRPSAAITNVSETSDTAPVLNGDEAMQVDEKEGSVTSPPTSKGWEDLTLDEKIYSLWSICEWQLHNPEKFKTFLTKATSEEHQVVWRIDPIGFDADNTTYWLFDDNRLWIERETPRNRELRLISEEAERKHQKKQAAREKRLLRNQRKRMRALHEARRIRNEARRIKEEQEQKDLEAFEAKMRAEDESSAARNGADSKKKRKRGASVSDEEQADFEPEGEESGRASSRIGRARLQERMASRTSRRRSTRNASSTDLSSQVPQGATEEEWEKIPAEWLKTEDEEKNEDPDFGADGGDDDMDDFAAINDELGEDSASDLSGVDEDDEELPRNAKSRRSSRKSPRKRTSTSTVAMKGEIEDDLDDGDLSPLEDDEDDDEEDEEEEAEADADAGQTFPDSRNNLGPSFDDEDKDLPDGFVQWELICSNLEEWNAFPERFADSENGNEIALLDYVTSTVIPGVHAAYEAIAEEKRRKREAEKAAIMRAKKEAERKAAKAAAKEAAAAAAAAGPAPLKPGGKRTRATVNAAKAPTPVAADLGKSRYAGSQPASSSRQNSRDVSEGIDHKTVEVDRRAARAKQREEEKKAREEAELMAALQATQEPVEEELKPEISAATEEPIQDVPVVPPFLPVPNAPVSTSGPPEDAEQPIDESLLPLYGDEEDDYFLDCSICKTRGYNLDANQKLVQCDTCDRWEHVACHREFDKKHNKPKRNFDVDDFQCEDCEGMGSQAIKVIPKTAKRSRSDAQKAGAAKGAEKRKALFEERRKQKAAMEAATGQKLPPQRRVKPLEKESPKPVQRNTKRSRQSGASELAEMTPSSPSSSATGGEPAPPASETHSDHVLQLVQASTSQPSQNMAHAPSTNGSDIAIDPNLGQSLSQADFSTIAMPGLMQPNAHSYAPSQSLPPLSHDLSSIPIPGLAPMSGSTKIAVPLPDFLAQGFNQQYDPQTWNGQQPNQMSGQ